MRYRFFPAFALGLLSTPFTSAAMQSAAPTTVPTNLFQKPNLSEKEAVEFHLVVTPAPLPVPALRYRFTTPPREATPGNAAAIYRSAFLLNDRAMWPPPTTGPARPDFGDLIDMTPQNFQYEAARIAIAEVPAALGVFRLASTREYCRFDWPLLENGIGTLLPELNHARAALQTIVVAAEVALLEQRFDDALRLLTDSFVLARHVGEKGPIVNVLIATGMRAATLEAMQWSIAAPDSPNLCYALADLTPTVESLAPSFDRDRGSVLGKQPTLEEMRQDPARAEVASLFIERVFVLNEKQRQARASTAPAVNLDPLSEQSRRPRATRRLAKLGIPQAEIDAMILRRVLTMDLIALFDAGYDEGVIAAERATRQLPPLPQAPQDKDDWPEYLQFASFTRCISACVRTDQTVAALRSIEAARAYAATHDGMPPKRLPDCVEPPAIANPADGSEFAYEVDGQKFTLTIPAPKSEAFLREVRYVVEFRSSAAPHQNR